MLVVVHNYHSWVVVVVEQHIHMRGHHMLEAEVVESTEPLARTLGDYSLVAGLACIHT